MKIESFFPFKDRTKNVLERSSVVYSIRCKTCNAEYIGKTSRILALRVDEHRTQTSSACVTHVKSNPSHTIDYDGVEVLDTADSDLKLQVKERLHILERKPELNEQLGSQAKYDMNTLIVTKYTQFK